MTAESSDLMSSYYRCRKNRHFIDTFYELFLAKSPEIAEMFAGTDFNIQRLMLRESLLEMLCFDRDIPGTREEVERLGRHHFQLQVTPEMYSMWLDALCEAIRKYDPEYSIELEQRWRQAMQKGINIMLLAYDRPPSAG